MVAAASGKDTLAKIRSQPINLVLLDVMMPKSTVSRSAGRSRETRSSGTYRSS